MGVNTWFLGNWRDRGENEMSLTDKRAKPASAGSKVIRSQTVIRAVGDFLFLGNRVYLLAQPDRMLTVKKIHWDSQTSDLEDDQGRVYRDVEWDEIEFWDPVEYNFPDE
jgi:hypothetical protein